MSAPGHEKNQEDGKKNIDLEVAESLSAEVIAMSSAMANPLGAGIWSHPLPLAVNLWSKKSFYRKGKWTDQEEAFTKALISAFNEGLLSIPSGTTLRSFLSEKLNWYVKSY
jgi:hypothetical protein